MMCWSGEDQASLVGLDFGQDRNPTPRVYSTSGVLIIRCFRGLLYFILRHSLIAFGIGKVLYVLIRLD
jgi:hypothetical protein